MSPRPTHGGHRGPHQPGEAQRGDEGIHLRVELHTGKGYTLAEHMGPRRPTSACTYKHPAAAAYLWALPCSGSTYSRPRRAFEGGASAPRHMTSMLPRAPNHGKSLSLAHEVANKSEGIAASADDTRTLPAPPWTTITPTASWCASDASHSTATTPARQTSQVGQDDQPC